MTAIYEDRVPQAAKGGGFSPARMPLSTLCSCASLTGRPAALNGDAEKMSGSIISGSLVADETCARFIGKTTLAIQPFRSTSVCDALSGAGQGRVARPRPMQHTVLWVCQPGVHIPLL